MIAAIFAVILGGASIGPNVHALKKPEVKAEMRNPGGKNPYIVFKWHDGDSGNNGWKLAKSVDNGPFIDLGTPSKDSGEAKDHNLKHGSTYKYRIVMKNISGYDATSNVVTAILKPDDPQALNATPDAENPNTVNLTWIQQRDRYPGQFDDIDDGATVIIERKIGSLDHGVTSCTDRGSFTDKDLAYNTKYTYRLKFKNTYGESSVSEATVTTGTKPAPIEPGNPSNPGNSGNPGKNSVNNPSAGTKTVKKPSLKKVFTYPATPGSATINVVTDTDYPNHYLEFYRDGTFYKQEYLQAPSGSFELPVAYIGVTTYTVKCYIMDGGQKVYGNEMSVNAKSGGMGKIKLTCTKINPRVVSLKWYGGNNPSGYYVYAGKKLIKNTSKIYFKYKKKAGKKSFRVVPYADIEGKRYTGRSSNKAKPKPNVARFSKSNYYKDRSDAMCPFFVKKISLKGKTYTITGYAVNKRRLKLEKYHRLKIRVLSCGKTAFSKTWKDLSVNAGASSSKRLVLKAKGKAGLDLHANCAYNAYWEPMW